jgi:hypothetical protein
VCDVSSRVRGRLHVELHGRYTRACLLININDAPSSQLFKGELMSLLTLENITHFKFCCKNFMELEINIICDKNRLRTAEMNFLRRTAGYTLLNHKRNKEILEELHVTPLEGKLCTYRHRWFQHVQRMEDNRLPEQLLNYHPKGRRRPGRPLKRLLDDDS